MLLTIAERFISTLDEIWIHCLRVLLWKGPETFFTATSSVNTLLFKVHVTTGKESAATLLPFYRKPDKPAGLQATPAPVVTPLILVFTRADAVFTALSVGALAQPTSGTSFTQGRHLECTKYFWIMDPWQLKYSCMNRTKKCKCFVVITARNFLQKDMSTARLT